jgi:hypothetical protein
MDMTEIRPKSEAPPAPRASGRAAAMWSSSCSVERVSGGVAGSADAHAIPFHGTTDHQGDDANCQQ